MAEAPEAQIRRLERSALVVGVLLVILAAASGGARAALGAAGGALVAAVSYRAIRAGVNRMTGAGVAPDGASRSPTATWGLVKFITRFAILGGIAYVMMVRLRAHPGWMLAGASSLVAAAALEAVRGLRRARP